MRIVNFIRSHPKICELTRFLFVGVLSTIIDFLCMSLFIYFFNIEAYSHRLFKVFLSDGTPSSWSVTVGTGVGFLLSLCFSYVCNTLFVFKETNDFAKTGKGVLLYLILSSIALGLQTGLMYLGYAVLEINEWLLKILITCVTMVFNYVTRKKLVFSKTKADANLRSSKHFDDDVITETNEPLLGSDTKPLEE